MSIRDDVKKIPSAENDLRKFGFTVGVVLLGLGAWSWWRGHGLSYWFVVPAVVLLAGGAWAPRWLRPLHKAWMMLALLMGWVMTRVILTLLFYLVVTPIGLLLRLFGKDFIQPKFDRQGTSDWIPRTTTVEQRKDYERQF